MKPQKDKDIVKENDEIVEVDNTNAKPEVSGRRYVSTSYVHSGPIPPPEMLAKYDQVLPGAADRILTMAEKEQGNRHYVNKKIVDSGSRDSLLGIISAFILCLVALAYGGYIILSGHPVTGTIISGSGMIGLATVFIYGTNNKQEEKQKESNVIDENE